VQTINRDFGCKYDLFLGPAFGTSSVGAKTERLKIIVENFGNLVAQVKESFAFVFFLVYPTECTQKLLHY